MEPLGNVQPYLEQALAEHHELHAFADSILRLLATPPREVMAEHFETVVARMKELRDRLQAHFAQEEEGGYLDEAVSRAPNVAAQAAALQRQHQRFVELGDQIIERAGAAKDWRHRWNELGPEVQRFIARLVAHEEAENALLAKAFNVDLT